MNKGGKEQRVTTAGQASELFRKRRKAKGLSQAELASKLGVSQARLSAIENDRTGLTLERLIALTNLLDLEVVIRDRVLKKPAAGW
jgi:HTH-type transcriptional regulator / antitoxin HipB